MISSGGKRPGRAVALLLLAGLAAAACTTTDGAQTTSSSSASSTSSLSAEAPTDATVPPTTLTPAAIDGSFAVVAPDPTGLPSVSEPDPEIVIGELDNGLRYLLRANDNPGGRVDMRLAVDAGSAVEDGEQVGGAHFLEHMLFNGTERYPENELVAVLRSFGAAFGADINAYTSVDETVYSLTMPTEDAATVETGLDVLHQWLTAATIDEQQVVAERGVIVDEWRGSASDAGGRIFDAVEALLLAGTPYEGKDPIGTRDAIEATTAEPLRRFYDDWYRPDNAAVIVVGEVDPGAIENTIADLFTSATPRSPDLARPDLTFETSAVPRVVIHPDADVAEGFAAVLLPTVVDTAASPEARLQRTILDSLLFDVIATRLNEDALRGEAPFDDATQQRYDIVRELDAPGIVVSADGAALAESMQAVFDEYERVRRYGVTGAELDRAIASARRDAQSAFDARDTRQDASFADEYVRHVLTDEPIPTAEATFDFVNAVLDRATPETVVYGLVERLADAAPHVLVVVPEDEAAAVPAEDEFVAFAESMRDRDVAPRPAGEASPASLMTPPAPVAPATTGRLADGAAVSFIAPEILEFPNGARVVLNRTEIVAGNVAFEARSPGGVVSVADADVPSAQAAGPVVGASGVADFGPVALDAFLDDKEVALQPSIDRFTDGITGFSATDDLETLFQLIHLVMTAPRVDAVALEQYLDDELPFAEDPSIDPGYAEFVALLDARYDDPRFLVPTVESLAQVDAATIERVFRERFSNAGDWTFSFSGDLDIERAAELAATYIGTLPGDGTDGGEVVEIAEPPPPPGIVRRDVTAGDSESASVTLLFTAPATNDRRDDVAARIVREVISARLTDTIREELGETYSPFATVDVSAGEAPFAEVYLSNTAAPNLVGEVGDAVLAQIDDLRANGPTGAEFSSASAAVRQQLDLFNNPQINDEVLEVFTDPGGNPSFDAFLLQQRLVDTIDADDVQGYLQAWLPVDQYIEVVTTPR